MQQGVETLSPELQVALFLAAYTPEIAARTESILAEMRKRLPHALELVYDNYNALAIGFGPTERSSEAIFSIAVYPRWVSLFFLQAKGLSDPEKLLQGSGTVARHIVLDDGSSLDHPAIRALMQQAIERATVPFDDATRSRVVIKSVSAKKRPRHPRPGR